MANEHWSADEVVDLVDRNNNLTGKTAKRSQIHEQGLFHRTAHVYLFRSKSDIEYLTHQRTYGVDRHPGWWDARFGGHLKTGQDYDETAVEEVLEETGLKISIDDLLVGQVYFHESQDGKNREFTKVYYYHYEGNSADLEFQKSEVIQAKWMDWSDIAKEMKNQENKWTGNPDKLVEITNYLKQNYA